MFGVVGVRCLLFVAACCWLFVCVVCVRCLFVVVHCCVIVLRFDARCVLICWLLLFVGLLVQAAVVCSLLVVVVVRCVL